MKTQTVKSMQKEADKLYQIKLIKENPYSLISGEPTEVIHHYIYKSQSNNLRYEPKNGIPLTHAEHCRLHRTGDPDMIVQIRNKKGQEWHDELQKLRRIIYKMTKSNLKSIIQTLKEGYDI